MEDFAYIRRNLEAVRAELRAAADRSGRPVPTLVAVTKSAGDDEVLALAALGGVDMAENRVPCFRARRELLLANGYDLPLHLIGSLQTNKVKYIIDKVCMIHSLDSMSLAKEIEKQAAKRDIVMDVLVEINSGREENKSGLMPEDAADFCLSLSDFAHIRLRGFMTMAPNCEKNEEYRKYFQETSQLCLDIWQKKLHNIGRPILSMGMSNSYEAAIEEGACIVRVGRTLFAQQ